MARYVEILAVQRPFHFNKDNNDRHMFSVNFVGMAAGPVDKLEEEIIKILNTAGLGTSGVDTFAGAADLPTGNGPYTTIVDTGGTSPDETHNGSLYERISFQIVVRGKSFSTTRTRILAIWRELDGTRNSTIAA